MESTDDRSLRGLLHSRDEFFKAVVITGSLLSFGLNLLASGVIMLAPVVMGGSLSTSTFSTLLSQPNRVPFGATVVGFLCVITSLVYVFRVSLAKRTIRGSARACIFFDEKGKIISVPGYEFSWDLQKSLSAAIKENAAFANVWESDPVIPRESAGENSATTQSEVAAATSESPANTEVEYMSVSRVEVHEGESKPEPKAVQLLREALEFCFVDKLCSHLRGHFDRLPNVEDYIHHYGPTDLPHLLRSNRILSLLSTPLEDRAIFLKVKNKPKPSETLFMLRGSDGSMYTRFELTLPEGSVVERPECGVLRISNARLDMTLRFAYDGFSYFVSQDFKALYLGKEQPISVTSRQVRVDFEAIVRPSALFAKNGWEMHVWVDSFVSALKKYADFGMFLDSIQWQAVVAQIRVENNRRLFAKRAAESAEKQTLEQK